MLRVEYIPVSRIRCAEFHVERSGRIYPVAEVIGYDDAAVELLALVFGKLHIIPEGVVLVRSLRVAVLRVSVEKEDINPVQWDNEVNLEKSFLAQ